MRRLLRHETQTAVENPERRMLDARALFDLYKRSTGKGEVNFDVFDLVAIDNAFRGNLLFNNDREWLHDQLASQFDNQSTESKLAIIGHLVIDNQQLADELIDKSSESIKKDYRDKIRSANDRDASTQKRQAVAQLEAALSKVVKNISSTERAEKVEDKLGYIDPLDQILTDRAHKPHKIRISHLRAPELKDISEVPIWYQWKNLMLFLKQVKVPSQFLESWYGGNIDKRKLFLSEKVNQALKVGIELIKRMPAEKAGKLLLELCEQEKTFARQLAYEDVWDRRKEVTLPVGDIDDPKILSAFVRERLKQERHGGKKEVPKQFDVALEIQLAMIGIGSNIPALATDGIHRLIQRKEELDTMDFDQLYDALEKRVEDEDQYRPFVDQVREVYHAHLDHVKSDPSSKSHAALIEGKLGVFLDPTKDWERTAKTIEEMKQSNAPKERRGRTAYFPGLLINKCIQSYTDIPEDQRKARLALLEDFVDQPVENDYYASTSTERKHFFAERMQASGFFQEAARYAGAKNLKNFIAKTLQEGEGVSTEAFWSTQGWNPTDVLAELIYTGRQHGNPVLNPILELADHFLTSYTQIGREHYASEDAEKIGRQLQEFITKSKDGKQKSFMTLQNEDVAEVKSRITRYRALSWELWQQGHVPHDRTTRQRVLKMLVEDGRDRAIVELGLSADQKIELFVAIGKVAVDQGNLQALQQAITNAKHLKVYEHDNEARKLVADLEKEQILLHLQTDVARISTDKIKTLLDQTEFGKDAILNALIDSGRYHEAIIVCGELGQERIARQLIDRGAFDIAKELIKTAPSTMMPNRRLLLALIVYRQAGGEVAVEKPEHLIALVNELPTLLRAHGMSETDVLQTVREMLSDDQRLIIDRCIEVIGQEEFLKTAPSYEEDTLKHFYLDVLLDHEKNQEAIRFAVLHENGILSHLIKRLAKAGAGNDIEPLLYKIDDVETMNEITEALIQSGQRKVAQTLVKKFANSLTNESSVFKNVHITRRDGSGSTTNRASEQEQKKSIESLKRLIFASGALESLAHIRSLFSNEENVQHFVLPIFAGLHVAETSPRDLAKILSALGPEGIKWYSNIVIEQGGLNDIRSFVASLELLFPREEAMKRFPHLYAATIAASAREAFVEDVRNLSSRERVQKFVEHYDVKNPKDTLLLASLSLDKQEWNAFVAFLPPEERERAALLADWYAAPRIEEQKLGPIIERAALRLTQTIESGDVETLRLLLETLLSTRTPEAASKLTLVFLTHLEGGGRAETTYMLAKALSEMRSFKANTVLSEIMARAGTPNVLSRYIIRLLVENGHLDADLRGYFEEKRIADKSDDGKTLKSSVDRFRMLMRRYGINPDSAIMRYTDDKSNEEISASLEQMIERVKNLEERGQYQELGEQLMGDLNMRLLYFLKNGGRTRFSLINDYNFAKFTNVLQIGTTLELHNEPLETFEQIVRQFHHTSESERIIQRIREGRFPLSSEHAESIFALTVDANTESQAEQARSIMGSTLGRNEFGAFARAIMYRSFIDKMSSERKTDELEHLWQSAGQDLGSLNAFLEYCESTFSNELENITLPLAIEKCSSDDLPLRQSIREEALDVGITRIEAALAALGKKLTDNARKAAQQNKISKEERDRLLIGYQQPETVLATLLQGELPPSFAPAIDEWTSHIQSAIQAVRETRTLRRDTSQIRELQLRYLDKTLSLPEYLRFADSAMCCFTSKTFKGTGPQQYIARIWKDPLSFVFHIEEPSAELTDRRRSVGFVFGSYAVNREGEPVLILNGVYMDRKTDLAARKVLETIEQQLAKPLGCKELLTASQHAGRANYGAAYENTDREYLRLRAIKQQWNTEPEQHTYDDIGLIAVDAQEGRIQDSQAVNRWAKTGAHVLRKTVS